MNRFLRSIVGFSLKNRYFIFFLTGLVVIAGVWSYQHTPIEAFPDVTNTRIQIISQWPGRSAEEVEKYITIPLEVQLNAVPKKNSLRSVSLFGLSVVTIQFDDGVEDFFARQYVSNLIQDVDLPEGVNAEIQPPTGPTGEIYRYTLQGHGQSIRELKTIQDWVVERNLKAVPGVADVVSFGGQVRTFQVSIDPAQLAKYGITAVQVFQAIARNNINVGGDVIESAGQAYVVRGIGVLTRLADIENITVDNLNGTPILIRNVAHVEESSLPRLGQVGLNEHADVVEGIVLMRRGENPSEVLAKVRERVDQLNGSILPTGVTLAPFYDRTELIHHTTDTVLHNLTMGVVLVTVIVFLFMADWRTTFIVGIIIPLALLFAFVCMRIKGMSANLLSMGAIDFGIIIDGAVVMVEGLFVALDHRAGQVGMEKFNRLAKWGLIKREGAEKGKAIFFAKAIIICALLPIFAFQKVEGKMFSPLAWTLGFALLGALLFTLTLVPALVSVLLNRNVRERHNRFVEGMRHYYLRLFEWTYAHKRKSLIVALVVLVGGMYSFRFLGSEFLPQLNEGSIYVRASLPLSISLEKATQLTEQMRQDLRGFPEVRRVLSQTGRPNDGTDPTGFFNVEFFVDIYPKESWKRQGGEHWWARHTITKAELVQEMQHRLAKYPGAIFGFSQPIQDNVEEAVSGVKGSLAVKVYGQDMNVTSQVADQLYAVLAKVKGIEDLGVIPDLGQPELRIELDEAKRALYGVSAEDAQAVIEMAIGGKTASYLYEGNRRFDIRVRYLPQYRTKVDEIKRLLVPCQNGTKIPIQEIATIRSISGPAFVYREDNVRFAAVKFSIRGRDMGSTIQEAQSLISREVQLPKGIHLEWKGDFENQVRATQTLQVVVPISLVLIFLLLFVTFGTMQDSVLVLLTVPFALIGGIASLLITGTNFSISAGVGFIALFGVCVQNGVLLISAFKHNLSSRMSLRDSLFHGVESRMRPVVMTALMAALGLLPAALSTGIGSESQKPLAIVVIGGLVTATFLNLLVLPLLFESAYHRLRPELRPGHLETEYLNQE